MRIVLSPIGTDDEFFPMLALGKVLKERGHWVTFCAPEIYRSICYQTEFPMVSSGSSYQEYLETGSGGPDTPASLSEVLEQDMAMQFVSMRDALREADLVIASMLAFAAASIAGQSGIPYIHVLFHPLHLDEKLFPIYGVLQEEQTGIWKDRSRRKRKQLWNERVLRTLNREREFSRLTGMTDLQRYLLNSGHLMMAMDPDLAPAQENPHVTVTGCWFYEDPAEVDAELEGFLTAGPPPILITGFRSQDPGMTAVLKLACVELAQNGNRVLLEGMRIGWNPSELPEGCRFVESFPASNVLPRLAAVVHGGSTGWFVQATHAGVPQVIVPRTADQHFWSDRVRTLGIGSGPVQEDAVGKTVQTVMSDTGIRERTRTLAQRLRSRSGLSTAADFIDQLAEVPHET